MPYIREAFDPREITKSPISVAMPYLIRYCVIDHGGNAGQIAYDIYETMNRLAYFRDRGMFRHDATERDLQELSRIRNGDVIDPSAPTFWCPRLPAQGGDDVLVLLTGKQFFRDHGVAVNMEIFYEQVREQEMDPAWDDDLWEETFENACIEAANDAEAAQLIWNMRVEDAELTSDTDDLISVGSIGSELERFAARLEQEEN